MKKQWLSDHSLSRLIAEKISEQIITGELQPGDKLIESVYANEYGTSRAPVREALYILMIEGLVERIPRKGTIVKGYSERDIYDILEIRMVLETLAIKRIARFGVIPALMDKMETLLLQMTESLRNSERYSELNRQFHLQIIKMSRSDIIKNMYSHLGIPLLSLQRISFFEEKNIYQSMEEHEVIVNKLKGLDFEGALTVLEKHNGSVQKRVEQWMKGGVRPDESLDPSHGRR